MNAPEVAVPEIVVVGVGPAGPELLTAETLAAIAVPRPRFMRTRRHPAMVAVPDAVSFDDFYDDAATFDEVYGRIVDALIAVAGTAPDRSVLYAVPGSPGVLERSVDLLRQREGVEVRVLAAMSFLDLAWLRLGVDPLEDGVRLIDGHRFAERAAGERGPLLVAHCHNARVLSDIKLELDLDGPPITVLQRLGLPDEAMFTVERAELDRSFTADHLTSLWIADAVAPVASELARFDGLVRLLRQRCDWDRVQTHESLTRHLLEETYEVLDAIAGLPGDGEAPDPDADIHLEEELGDLLFQVMFHSAIATEEGRFTVADVARTVHDKLVARHPHVFGGEPTGWEELKQAEKGRASIFDGVPPALPSLALAAKILGKAATLGIGLEALTGDEVLTGDEDDPNTRAGRALLAVVADARAAGVDAEAALRRVALALEAAARAAEGRATPS